MPLDTAYADFLARKRPAAQAVGLGKLPDLHRDLMPHQRARVADNISAALRLIRQGYAAHAEAVLNETLDMMKENSQ